MSDELKNDKALHDARQNGVSLPGDGLDAGKRKYGSKENASLEGREKCANCGHAKSRHNETQYDGKIIKSCDYCTPRTACPEYREKTDRPAFRDGEFNDD